MIIYRPVRSTLEEAMKEVIEFNSEEEMKSFLSKTYANVDKEDIVIEGEGINDDRNQWKDTKYVCLKKYNSLDGSKIDLVERYGAAQCIGMCATNYPKEVQGNE